MLRESFGAAERPIAECAIDRHDGRSSASGRQVNTASGLSLKENRVGGAAQRNGSEDHAQGGVGGGKQGRACVAMAVDFGVGTFRSVRVTGHLLRAPVIWTNSRGEIMRKLSISSLLTVQFHPPSLPLFSFPLVGRFLQGRGCGVLARCHQLPHVGSDRDGARGKLRLATCDL